MYITDLHMHIVPRVDDGSESFGMSVEMLRSAYEQGVRRVFCTSHSWATAEQRDRYLLQLERLRDRLALEELDMELLTGNEVLFLEYRLEETLHQLKDGTLLPLNGSRYVLTEFFPSVVFSEALYIAKRLIAEGWIPVIAHAERCRKLTAENFEELCGMGCLLQINAYSLEEETNPATKDLARTLLARHLVSFIGSDAHRTDHRPPKYTRGVEYILRTCDSEYAKKILNGNAMVLFESATAELKAD